MPANHLNRTTVLVLNRNWQAIHVKCPAEALSMMYAETATGLDIVGEDNMVPYRWNDWVNLPHDESSDYISTVNQKIKIPKVVVNKIVPSIIPNANFNLASSSADVYLVLLI